MTNRLSHRLAWLLVLATFPLVCMGGMVTTYGAGMAVPDWPTTFGWWWYPVRSWFLVWDVFLEHGHRVIGMTVGLVTVALAVSLWRGDRRPSLRWLGLAAVAGVCFQGTLGGLRVIGNEIILADVHGCTAPLFFSLAAALVTLTSPRWLADTAPQKLPGTARYQQLALAVAVLVYVQIVIGAQLRHRLPEAALYWFQIWLWAHLLNAALLGTVLAFVLRSSVRRAEHALGRRAWLVASLYLLQLVLGVLTWLTHYGLPAWFRDYVWSFDYTIVTKGWLQALTTTTHVAAGSLTLLAAVSLVLWSRRLLSR